MPPAAVLLACAGGGCVEFFELFAVAQCEEQRKQDGEYKANDFHGLRRMSSFKSLMSSWYWTLNESKLCLRFCISFFITATSMAVCSFTSTVSSTCFSS